MIDTPGFTEKEWPLAFELLRALDDASSFSELYESTEQVLAGLCGAHHVALCMARPDNPMAFEFKTRTLQPLLGDLPRWSSTDFVSRGVIQRPNKALTEREMLQGTAIERTETWRRSRDKGLDLHRALAMLVLPEGPGVAGGVTLYWEDPRLSPRKSQRILDWFMPRFRRAFQNIHRITECTTRQQVLESIAGQDSAALVLTSRGKEFLRTASATALLRRWFSRFELDASGLPRQWVERLALLVRMDGQLGPELNTWRREGTCRDLEVTFLPLHVAGLRLWELKLKETVLLPEAWRVLLTPTQLQVADCVLRGMQDKEIALELHMALATVKEHTDACYVRVGADKRNDFISRALRLSHTP